MSAVSTALLRSWMFVPGHKQKMIDKALGLATLDAVMLDLHAEFPQYGFDRHKGYGTAAHLAALRAFGATRIHRRSFAPVRAVIEHD